MHRSNNQQRLLYSLVNRSINLCKAYTNQESLESVCQKYQMVKLLGGLDVHQLHLDRKTASIEEGVGICNIMEQNSLRITVYYLPKGQTMKLHDHPTMEVVSYLLQGKMRAQLYTPLQADIYLKRVTTLQKGSCSFIDGQRGNQQNLHEFLALQPTYFLDIIFPDYDAKRPCRFFEEGDTLEDEKVKLREVFDYDVTFHSLL